MSRMIDPRYFDPGVMFGGNCSDGEALLGDPVSVVWDLLAAVTGWRLLPLPGD